VRPVNMDIDLFLDVLEEGNNDLARTMLTDIFETRKDRIKDIVDYIISEVKDDGPLTDPLADIFAEIIRDEDVALNKELERLFDLSQNSLTGKINMRNIINDELAGLLQELESHIKTREHREVSVRSIDIDTDEGTIKMSFEDGTEEELFLPENIGEILSEKKEIIRSEDIEGVAASVGMREAQKMVRDADPFMNEIILSEIEKATDPSLYKEGPTYLVIDFSLIENDDGNEFRQILEHIGEGVELVVVSEEVTESMALFLETNYGLSPSEIADKKISFITYRGLERDADRFIMDELMKNKKLGPADMNRIRFLGNTEKKREGVYGRYLDGWSKEGLVVLYGDKLNSLAHLITCILTVKNRGEIQKALRDAGFSDGKIREMLPQSGEIPPVPSTRNYLNNIEKYQQSRHLFEIAA
jgi:hypothetical protein